MLDDAGRDGLRLHRAEGASSRADAGAEGEAAAAARRAGAHPQGEGEERGRGASNPLRAPVPVQAATERRDSPARHATTSR